MPAETTVPPVMVLGTYHLANPGRDLVKVRQRDTLGEDRQREIAQVVEGLARFEPTVLLVEDLPERQGALDEAYQAYCKGEANLTDNEIQQVGFRLARMLGHDRLVGIDYRSDMDFDRLFAYAAQMGRADFAERLSRRAAHMGEVMSRWDERYTVGQILALHNDPENLRAGHQVYVELVEFGEFPEYPGADLVGLWYRRNLVIFENLRRALTPGARALVVYGSGHAYFLNQLVRDDARMEWVDCVPYLPAAPKDAESPYADGSL